MSTNNSGLRITLAVLLAVGLLAPPLGSTMGLGGMMGPQMMSGSGGMMGAGASSQVSPDAGWVGGLALALGELTTLAFWGAISVGIVLLVRALSGSGRRVPGAGDTPLETLRRRYASGEISREQYEQMR